MKIARYEKKPSLRARALRWAGRTASVHGLGLGALGVWLYLQPAPQGFPILEYHMIKDKVAEDEYDYAVPVEDFKAQLDYLKAEGYETITLQDYMKARKGTYTLPKKPIVLTFDDGYDDNYTNLLPLLEERGMRGTVYMVTKILNENRDYLVEQFASLSGWDPETCWEPEKIAGLELHPGAERYYKEAGYIKE